MRDQFFHVIMRSMIQDRKGDYLFHEVAIANDDHGTGIAHIIQLTIIRASRRTLFEIPGDDELEFPGTFFEEVVHTGHPAPCGIG